MRVFIILILMMFLGNLPAFAFARKPAASQSLAGKKYACPMLCRISEAPGKCPKCGMEMWEVSQT